MCHSIEWQMSGTRVAHTTIWLLGGGGRIQKARRLTYLVWNRARSCCVRLRLLRLLEPLAESFLPAIECLLRTLQSFWICFWQDVVVSMAAATRTTARPDKICLEILLLRLEGYGFSPPCVKMNGCYDPGRLLLWRYSGVGAARVYSDMADKHK